MLMRIQKYQKLQVSQFNDHVLTYWITNGWQKTTWVKFSANPVASTNQFCNWRRFSSSKIVTKMHHINIR